MPGFCRWRRLALKKPQKIFTNLATGTIGHRT
jgi:hypothetical protein